MRYLLVIHQVQQLESLVPPNKKSKGLSQLLSHCFTDVGVQTATFQKVKQIDQYLTHPQLDILDDPLDWWKSGSLSMSDTLSTGVYCSSGLYIVSIPCM